MYTINIKIEKTKCLERFYKFKYFPNILFSHWWHLVAEINNGLRTNDWQIAKQDISTPTFRCLVCSSPTFLTETRSELNMWTSCGKRLIPHAATQIGRGWEGKPFHSQGPWLFLCFLWTIAVTENVCFAYSPGVACLQLSEFITAKTNRWTFYANLQQQLSRAPRHSASAGISAFPCAFSPGFVLAFCHKA